MARRNIAAALVLILFGAWYGFMTAGLPNRTMPNTPDPSFFPWLITISLLALSAGLLGQGIVGLRTSAPAVPVAASLGKPALALVWFTAYLVMLPYVGFLAASIPFFGGLMLLYGERNKLFLALAAIVTPVVLFYLFRHAFQIVLPRGVW